MVAFQYHVSDPFASSVAINSVIPFGAFWRSFHFWSSQAFFLLLIYHLWENIKDFPLGKKSSKAFYWSVLTTILPLSVLTLFTGYILRGDATGQSAGMIAENLVLKIPVVGIFLNRLLFSMAEEGLNRVYAIHMFFTAFIWGLGTWYHTRKVNMDWNAWNISSLSLIIISIFVIAPMDPVEAGAILIKGPWFFLGIQELLRHFHPLLAGIIYPVLPFVLIAALSWIKSKKPVFIALLFWLTTYIIATIIALLR